MRVVFRCDPALKDVLPPPQPARDGLPEWLVRMPRHADSALHGGDIRTVKHCPPFIDAMTHGFVIPLPCDVTFEAGVFSWDWDCPPPAARAHPRAPLSFHVAEQLTGTPWYRPGQSAIKFNSFWTIELEPGWSLYATHPVNRDDLPFRLLSGIIDADRFHDVGILFPAIWTDPDFKGVLPRGTPVAQCIPVRREALDLVIETMDEERVRQYDRTGADLHAEAGVYRRRFRDRRSGASGQATPQVFGIEE